MIEIKKSSLSRLEEFNTFLQDNKDKLVLVKFSAKWCGPCKVLQESIEKLEKLEPSGELQKVLVVLEVDADRFPQLEYRDQNQKVQQLVVYSLPTFFLFYQGKMVKEGRGSKGAQQLKEFISI